MGPIIQILVAGSLLAAWIWVLGRPLVAGTLTRSTYDDLDRYNRATAGVQLETDPDRDLNVDVSPDIDRAAQASRGPLPAPLRWWAKWEPNARRRQLLMGSMLAAFASFLMAIALRGSYVYLFLLMLVVMALHLSIASYLGGRIVASERAVVVSAAKKMVRTSPMAIRAPRAGESGDSPPAPGGQILDGLDYAEMGRDPVVAGGSDTKPVAADVSAFMLPDEASDPFAAAASSFVSDLIEDAWGADPILEEPVVDAPAADDPVVEEPVAEEQPVVEEPVVEEQSVDEEPVVEEPAVEAESEETSGDAAAAEPIFTRAAKDEPSRARRKAQPIYIESQLDDDDDLPGAKAVNHP